MDSLLNIFKGKEKITFLADRNHTIWMESRFNSYFSYSLLFEIILNFFEFYEPFIDKQKWEYQ